MNLHGYDAEDRARFREEAGDDTPDEADREQREAPPGVWWPTDAGRAALRSPGRVYTVTLGTPKRVNAPTEAEASTVQVRPRGDGADTKVDDAQRSTRTPDDGEQ